MRIIQAKFYFLKIYFTGVGHSVRGSARLHRPAKHPREQVLLHDPRQQRRREAVKNNNDDKNETSPVCDTFSIFWYYNTIIAIL